MSTARAEPRTAARREGRGRGGEGGGVERKGGVMARRMLDPKGQKSNL